MGHAKCTFGRRRTRINADKIRISFLSALIGVNLRLRFVSIDPGGELILIPKPQELRTAFEVSGRRSAFAAGKTAPHLLHGLVELPEIVDFQSLPLQFVHGQGNGILS